MFAKIYLEITNVCNLSCSFCAGTTRKKHYMTREEFEFLTDRLRPYTEFLYFHLMGEPTTHPLIGDFLTIAHARGFRVILTTNGTLLPKVSDTLLAAPALFKVSLSLHAFEANSGIDFESYLQGCFDFADRASQQGIISVFRLWNDGGKNGRNTEILHALHKRFPGEWMPNTKGIRIRKKLFIESGETFIWPPHAKACEKIACYALKDHIGVLCDGSVVPCCLDSDGSLVLGNLFETPLDTILSAPQAAHFRKALDRNDPPTVFCRKCGFAQTKFHADLKSNTKI